MGAEVLEETEFDPFFTELESKISGLKVALFGSYGWGDGHGCVTGTAYQRRKQVSSTPMRAPSSTKPRMTTASQSARSSARASQHSKLDFLRRVHTCAQRRKQFLTVVTGYDGIGDTNILSSCPGKPHGIPPGMSKHNMSLRHPEQWPRASSPICGKRLVGSGVVIHNMQSVKSIILIFTLRAAARIK